jgi:ABC-type transport system involved in multi-copper enzyme maturation permease subunit
MKILAIAFNTFRESVRDKILIGVLSFATLFIVSSIATVNLTIGQFMRLTTDVGLSSIDFFGIILSIFLGISLVYKEIERKTVYTIVSKPIRRSSFLLGKYLGLIITVFVNTAIMLAVLYGVLVYISRQESNPYLGIFQAWMLMMMEFMVITAVAVLFSTFSTPTLSAMFTLAVWMIGHLLSELRYWGLKSDNPAILLFVKIINFFMPQLELLNMRNRVTYHIAIGWDYVGWASAYAAMYTILVLLIASIIFSRRDFK